jgi:general stress protein 26
MPAMAMVTTENAGRIERLLAAARETIAEVPYCWLATCDELGGANARAVRSHAGAPGDDEWTRRFLTRRSARKVAEIRRAPRVTLAYQANSGDAYIALAGLAHPVEDRAQMRSLWNAKLDALFPDGFADANMIVVRVEIDRIELHARGVTAEPFGHGRTVIQRVAADGWRFAPD